MAKQLVCRSFCMISYCDSYLALAKDDWQESNKWYESDMDYGTVQGV